MTSYVVDASVAAKWFLPAEGESHNAEASELLRQCVATRVILIAPELFWTEYGNIFWKAARRKRISVRDAEIALDALASLPIRAYSSVPLLSRAFAIASAYDRTVYDATYVALATETSAPFLTADQRLANALETRFPVRWLGAYGARA